MLAISTRTGSCLVLLSTLALVASAQTASPQQPQTASPGSPGVLSNHSFISESMNSLLLVVNPSGLLAGSGVLISNHSRLAITNHHVIRGSEHIRVFFPALLPSGNPIRDYDWYFENAGVLTTLGLSTSARVMAQDSDTDIAILLLDSVPQTARGINYSVSALGCDEIGQGASLHFLGNPSFTFADKNGRQVPIGLWQWGAAHSAGCHNDDIQVLAAVFTGNSGGPLLTNDGALIGIIKASDGVGTFAAASPISAVNRLLGELQQHPVIPIKNNTAVPIKYAYRWSAAEEWTISAIGPGKCVNYFPSPDMSEASFMVTFDADLTTVVRRKDFQLELTAATMGQLLANTAYSYCSEPFPQYGEVRRSEHHRYEFNRGTGTAIRLEVAEDLRDEEIRGRAR